MMKDAIVSSNSPSPRAALENDAEDELSASVRPQELRRKISDGLPSIVPDRKGSYNKDNNENDEDNDDHNDGRARLQQSRTPPKEASLSHSSSCATEIKTMPKPLNKGGTNNDSILPSASSSSSSELSKQLSIRRREEPTSMSNIHDNRNHSSPPLHDASPTTTTKNAPQTSSSAFLPIPATSTSSTPPTPSAKRRNGGGNAARAQQRRYDIKLQQLEEKENSGTTTAAETSTSSTSLSAKQKAVPSKQNGTATSTTTTTADDTPNSDTTTNNNVDGDGQQVAGSTTTRRSSRRRNNGRKTRQGRRDEKLQELQSSTTATTNNNNTEAAAGEETKEEVASTATSTSLPISPPPPPSTRMLKSSTKNTTTIDSGVAAPSPSDKAAMLLQNQQHQTQQPQQQEGDNNMQNNNNSNDSSSSSSGSTTTTTTGGDGVDETDQFATRVILDRLNLNRQTTISLKGQFQIDVEPNAVDPNRCVDIHLTGPDVRGLLTIVLMALEVRGWNIVQVIKKRLVPPPSPIITEDDGDGGGDGQREQQLEQEAHKEEEGEDGMPTTTAAATASPQPRPSAGNNNDDGRGQQQCIMVEFPLERLETPNTTDDRCSLLKELQKLLTSACEDFMSPRRSLQPLVHAFETSIEPRRGANNTDVRTVQRRTIASVGGARVSFGGATNKSAMPFGGGRRATTAGNDTDAMIQSLPDFGMDIEAVQVPGAVYTPGRAFGAPYRSSFGNRIRTLRQRISDGLRPRSRSSTGGGMSSRRLLRTASSRRQLSSRILGVSSRLDSNATPTAYPIASAVLAQSDDDDNDEANDEEKRKQAAVDTEALEADIRKKVIQEAPTASAVVPINSDDLDNTSNLYHQQSTLRQRRLSALCCIFIVLIIGIAIGTSVDVDKGDDAVNNGGVVVDVTDDENTTQTDFPTLSSMSPSASPTTSPPPILTTVLDRGYVRCSVNVDTTLWNMETDLCRAIAAALFGNSSKIELVPTSRQRRFIALQKRQVDVLIRSTTHTTSRSIQEKTTGRGFEFSTPYFYDGLVFGGLDDHTACADTLDTFFGICRTLVVCVVNSTTHAEFVNEKLPEKNVKIVETWDNVLINEECNVIGDDSRQIKESLKIASGYSANGNNNETLPFQVGSNSFTREPLAMVTRSDDYEWSLFVETVLQGLLEAESRNITQSNATLFPDLHYFGPNHRSMVARAVQSVGNFGDVYERGIGSFIPRRGLNELRTTCEGKGAGLLYPYPFGSTLDIDPLVREFGQIADILKRGKLRCGVPPDSEPTSAFNIEICKAVGAALFGKSANLEEMVVLIAVVDATEALKQLLGDQLDIVTGVASHILPTLNTTMRDISFSNPYLFLKTTESFVVATASNHHQWSIFVQWAIMAILLAEQKFVTMEDAELLPGAALYGPAYSRIFTDVVAVVGNYEEIYDRTIWKTVDRSGCNQLNLAPHGPQHFPFLFYGL